MQYKARSRRGSYPEKHATNSTPAGLTSDQGGKRRIIVMEPTYLSCSGDGWSGRVQQANIMLGKGNRNMILPKSFQDGLIQFNLG